MRVSSRANIHKITSELFSVRANAKEAVFKVFRSKKYLISVYEPRDTACNYDIFLIPRFMNCFFGEKEFLQSLDTYTCIYLNINLTFFQAEFTFHPITRIRLDKKPILML